MLMIRSLPGLEIPPICPSTRRREDLVRNEKVRELFDGIVAEVNRDLAQFEKLKKILLVAEEFSVADGSLTPTLKLKRRVVEERFRPLIQQLYAEAEMAPEERAASGP